MNDFSNLQDEFSLIISVEWVAFFWEFSLSDLYEDDSIVYAYS